jgi:hypothetical protein
VPKFVWEVERRCTIMTIALASDKRNSISLEAVRYSTSGPQKQRKLATAGGELA